jgi:hypothetical protein
MKRRDGSHAGKYLLVRSEAVSAGRDVRSEAGRSGRAEVQFWAARSVSLRAVITGYLTVILRIL